MRVKERLFWFILGALSFYLLSTLFPPLFAQTTPAPSQIALSAGEKGVVYFYDGANLWYSPNYGGEWVKVK